MKRIFTSLILMVVFVSGYAQIFEPEGLNMPGAWNKWINPPVNKLAFASATQVPGGKVTKITTGTTRWQTTLKIAASGGDTTAGTYAFLFTSGPSANAWANAWKDVTVSMNTLQAYNYYTSGGTDNSVTLVNGNWYTVNWEDAGYANTHAIFMQTSGFPVDILTVTQTPAASQVFNGQSVTVNITLGSAPSPEEKFYVRYSNDGYATSFLAPVTIAAASGSATIPALTDTVSYYVFSTTVLNPVSDYDMYTIKFNNNGGPNYSFAYKSDVTFKVDMSQQTVSPNGIHLVGDFQGWDSVATIMAPVGNGVYAVTLPVNTGSYQEYKFLNGDTFAATETVPSTCGADDGLGGYNRYFTVQQPATILPLVCFSSCVACPVMVPVTFSVDMSLETVSADGVHLTGEFQGWNTTSTPMALTANNIYSVTVQLPENTEQTYKFINGNTFAGVEIVPAGCGTPDGSGGFNRSVSVGTTGINLDVVCFSQCGPCPSPHNVTFKVDMSFQTVSADGVHLAGTFQGWDPSATPMTDIGNNVYTASVLIDAGVQAQYKFINGIAWENEETVPQACGVDDGQGGFNRFLTIPGADTTLATVCFSTCSICNVGISASTGLSAAEIYPNPATDRIFITLNANNGPSISAELYNTDGKKVFTFQGLIPGSGKNTITLNTGRLPRCIYYLMLHTGNDNAELITRKIIFQ